MERAEARRAAEAVVRLQELARDDSPILAVHVNGHRTYIHLKSMRDVMNLGKQLPVRVTAMPKEKPEESQWYEVSVVFGGVEFISVGFARHLEEAGLAEPK